MTLNALRAISLTLQWESDAYTNRQNDRGGPTKYGITWRTLQGVTGSVAHPRDLTLEEALRIYHVHFWQPLRLDELRREDVAAKVFDFSVTSGPVAAVKTLQRALNAAAGAKLRVDGKIGPATIAAANADGAKTNAVLDAFIDLQGAYYEAIIENDPSQEENRRGWMRRAAFDPRRFHV